MKKITATILSALLCAAAFAGTPAEDLMNSVKDEKGVQVIEAKGFIMNFARGAIRKTPMKPLADQVTAVTVCKMEKASPEFIRNFETEARKMLKGYQFYGIKPGEEGRPVETYGTYPVENVVTEIVVFNPDLHSLFSLRGRYTIEDLMSLDKGDR